MSDKQIDRKKLLDQMRINTDQQNRKTEGDPVKRSRRKLPKGRPTDGAEKQK